MRTPRPCGPLKRPKFVEDQLTQRFTRQILLEEQHHSNSDAKRGLFSEESKYLMAHMAKEVSKLRKVAKQTLTLLLDREALSWSVKVAILQGIDWARGRKQVVHPPCKATWSTETNYVTYCKKIGILFAVTDGADTTALDIAAGAGGSRLKCRMEELFYRWKYVLFFVEVPKTEAEGSTYVVTMIPNQYAVKTPFEGNYKCGGSNAMGRTMPDRRYVLVVPRFTALMIADKHRCLTGVFGAPKPKRGASVLSRADSDDPRTFWLHDAPVDFVALREHCATIRNVFDPNMWQMPIGYPRGDPHALERVDRKDGRDVGMLYQEESSVGHRDYVSYPALEEVPRLADLRVRKNPSQEEGGPVTYSITIYESPYSAYGEAAESTKAQFQEWFEAVHGCFIRDALFEDIGEKHLLAKSHAATRTRTQASGS